MSRDRQQLAARMARWRLRRDDTGPHRVYRDRRGRAYSSITHIINATAADPFQRPEPGTWFADYCKKAAQRGTTAHSSVEYLLKTAKKLLTNSANRRNLWRVHPTSGLWTVPTPLTKWALSKAYDQLPDVPFYASGYAKNLVNWAMDSVTGIYLIEFSVCQWSPALHHGFAGTGDALLDINGKGPYPIDWKTSNKPITEATLTNYRVQIAAYALGIRAMTRFDCPGGYIVTARRAGSPSVHEYLGSSLTSAQNDFLSRFRSYCDRAPEPR